MSLEKDKKLTILFRVEPGCLGPHGRDHINEFCEFAQQQYDALDSALINWVIVSRSNKHLPETEYKFANKNLTEAQAIKFLSRFDKELEEFEEELHDKLTDLIDQFASANPALFSKS